MDFLRRVGEKLSILRQTDPSLRVFGASEHNYQLAPALSEREIWAFEQRHRVRLPSDYRAFLLEMGSSGAGPGYGLLPLAPLELSQFPAVRTVIEGADIHVESGTPARLEPTRTSSLSEPFLLKAAWIPVWEYDVPPIAEEASPYDGCIQLCDQGCGYFDFLVVQGTTPGQVWSDTMAAVQEGGMQPTGMSFSEWYEAWLDEALESVR